MNTRNDDLKANNKELSTTKMTHFLQEKNKSNNQVAKLSASLNDLQKEEKLVITKSYRPPKLPTKTEREALYGQSYREAVRKGDIRTDNENLRYDPERKMYIWPSSDDTRNLPLSHEEDDTSRCKLF
jgi:hypothetical protein